jgi:RHS repeat-associated protein
VRNEQGIIRQPIRFQGQYHDEETGLYYNRFRFYDPLQGRYVTQDPIGLLGELNAYVYPMSPAEEVDPLGLVVKVIASNPREAKILQKAYARLNKTAHGRSITGPLERSTDVYVIRPIPQDAYYCSPAAAAPGGARECRGHPRTVFMDPHNNLMLPTTAGMQPASKACILGHELGHAAGAHDDGPNQMNNVIANENPIRLQLGEPARTSYTVPAITWVPGTH